PPRENAPLATGRPVQPAQAPMTTLRIDGGKTDKLRPGDILGALTGAAGLPGPAIGKIVIGATRSYVAIANAQVGRALQRREAGKITGRRFRVRKLCRRSRRPDSAESRPLPRRAGPWHYARRVRSMSRPARSRESPIPNPESRITALRAPPAAHRPSTGRGRPGLPAPATPRRPRAGPAGGPAAALPRPG